MNITLTPATATTARAELVATYWDLHKSVYGFKPRSVNFDALSDAQLEQMIERVEADYAHMKRQRDLEAEQERLEDEELARRLGVPLKDLARWGVI